MYKFNGGAGAVICDQCRKMIDSHLSLAEYERTWGTSGEDGDFCMRCRTGENYNHKQGETKVKHEKHT